MLQIKDIRKQYITGELIQTALDGVSLNLRDNEFVAILGPSGCGKTTMLNIIGGLDHYTEGDLIPDEEQPDRTAEEQALTRYANELTGQNDPDLVSAAETLIKQRLED